MEIKAQWESVPLWQRMIVMTILPFVFIYSVWFYLLVPKQESIEKLRVDIQKTKKEIDKLKALRIPSAIEKLEEEIGNLEKELKEKEEEFRKVFGELPSRNEISKLVNNLISIAMDEDVAVLSVNISYERFETKPSRNHASQRSSLPTNAADTASITMALEGQESSIYNLLRKLSSMKKPFYINSLEVNKEARGLRVVISIVTILKKEYDSSEYNTAGG